MRVAKKDREVLREFLRKDKVLWELLKKGNEVRGDLSQILRTSIASFFTEAFKEVRKGV